MNITIENKLNTIMRCLAAESENDREQARVDLRKMLSKTGGDMINTSKNVEQIIADVLVDIGVPCHISGYSYLTTAIRAVVENNDLISTITKELYPTVAKEHNSTASKVERAIRHAIECCCDRSDFDTIWRYFGNTISSDKGKPTNSEFIARMANVVRFRLQEGF